MIREMEAGRVFREPIVTEITPAPEFYSAEEHHQEYFRNNASQPYCMFVVAPKLATFREKFSSKRKRQKPGTG
ncbi:MAG: peptide-methionine (S)-S-oxide reductase [Acidobacteria bacterium]|nr:peptide-methionine (S)-S-oxide reductase [Acidobacteriota bacterium]